MRLCDLVISEAIGIGSVSGAYAGENTEIVKPDLTRAIKYARAKYGFVDEDTVKNSQKLGLSYGKVHEIEMQKFKEDKVFFINYVQQEKEIKSKFSEKEEIVKEAKKRLKLLLHVAEQYKAGEEIDTTLVSVCLNSVCNQYFLSDPLNKDYLSIQLQLFDSNFAKSVFQEISKGKETIELGNSFKQPIQNETFLIIIF